MKKIMSLLVMFSFILNTLSEDISFSAPLAGRVDPLILTDIPADLGRISDNFNGKNGKTIINILDAHCAYDAQVKISDILKYICGKYGVDTVNMEGGDGWYDLWPFTAFGNIPVMDKVAKTFLREGELSGAELYAIDNPGKVRLWGVENPKLYLKNLTSFQSVYRDKISIDSVFSRIETRLSFLSKEVLNGKLRDLMEKRGAYTREKMEFKGYMQNILGYAVSESIALDKFPNLELMGSCLKEEDAIDFDKVQDVRDALMEALDKVLSGNERKELMSMTVRFKMNEITGGMFYGYLISMAERVYPAPSGYEGLVKYRKYLSYYEKTDKIALSDEIEAVEAAILGKLTLNAEERLVRDLIVYTDTLKDFLEMEMTSSSMAKFREMRKAVGKKVPLGVTGNMAAESQGAVDAIYMEFSGLLGYIKSMGAAYSLSLERDKAFIGNMKVSGPEGGVAVIVTGGYHSVNIRKLAEKRGYSYRAVIPSFREDPESKNSYYDLISGGLPESIAKLRNNTPSSSIALASFNTPLGEKARGMGADAFKLLACLRIAREEGARGIELEGGYYDLEGNMVPEEYVHSPEEYYPFVLPGKGISDYEVRRGGKFFANSVLAELAKRKNVSEEEIKRDHELRIQIETSRMREKGFIDPKDDKIAEMMHRIFDDLARGMKKTWGYDAGNFYFVDSNDISALTFMGKKDVFFSRGLVEKFFDYSKRTGIPVTEDMIAGVIAHELGHVMQNSSTHGLDVKDLYGDDSPHYIKQMMTNAEYDADAKGLDIMGAAGYSVHGAIAAIRFLEYIDPLSQSASAANVHPYSRLRRHRLTQILYEQETKVFSNSEVRERPVGELARIHSKDADFRDVINADEASLKEKIKDARTVDEVREYMSMMLKRRKMDIIRSLMGNKNEREAFIRAFYLKVARYYMGWQSGRDMPRMNYSDLRQAGVICGFGKQDGKFIDGSLASKAGEVKAPGKLDRVKGPLKKKRFINASIGIINRVSRDVGGDMLDDLLMDPYEVMRYVRSSVKAQRKTRVEEKAQEILRKEKEKGVGEGTIKAGGLTAIEKYERQERLTRRDMKVDVDRYEDLGLSAEEISAFLTDKKVKSLLKDPRLLISFFVYTHCVSFVPSVGESDPVYGLSIEIPVNSARLYHDDPRFTNVSTKEGRDSLREVIIAKYLLDEFDAARPQLDEKFTGDLVLFVSRAQTPFRELKELSDVSGSPYFGAGDIGPVFEKLHGLLAKTYHPALAAHTALILIERSFGPDVLSDRERLPVGAGDILYSRSSWRGFAEAYRRSIASGPASASGFLDGDPFFSFISGVFESNPEKIGPDMIEKYKKAAGRLRSGSAGALRDFRELADHIAYLEYFLKPKRDAQVSVIFGMETDLYLEYPYSVYKRFEDILDMPNWQAEEVLAKIEVPILTGRIKDYLKEGGADRVKTIMDFIRDNFPYDTRYKIVETLFAIDNRHVVHEEMVYDSTFQDRLFEFFGSEFGYDPGKITSYIEDLLTRDKALKFMEAIAERLYFKMKNEKFGISVKEEELAIGLFEHCCRRATGSRYYCLKPESVPKYLELLERNTTRDFPEPPADEIRKMVMRGLSHLCQGAPVEIKPVLKKGRSHATNDLDDYLFAINDNKTEKRSAFVLCLADLGADELKELLILRKELRYSKADLEYQGRRQYDPFYNDMLADILTSLFLRTKSDPGWKSGKRRTDILKEVLFCGGGSMSVIFDHEKISLIPVPEFISILSEVCIQTAPVEVVISKYLEKRKLRENSTECYRSVPGIAEFIDPPTLGNALDLSLEKFQKKLKTHVAGRKKVSYRDIITQFAEDKSLYSRLYEIYLENYGEGYTWGELRPLDERMAWADANIPKVSLFRDNIFDLWEAKVFPEILNNSPRVIRLVEELSKKKVAEMSAPGGEEKKLWSLINTLEDDVGKMKCLDELDKLPENRLREIYGFYDRVIPMTFLSQKRARYGYIAYTIWAMLPENKGASLKDRIGQITRLMPEPNVLRDGILLDISNKNCKKLKERRAVSSLLLENNLIERNKDLRTHDFMVESVMGELSMAGMKGRVDILLWLTGKNEKPKYVAELEDRLLVSFDSLPDDIKFLPASMRNRCLEGFMLGDNGVLDPKLDKQVDIMEYFLGEIFDDIFPERSRGLDDDDRSILREAFVEVMKAYQPYRRVQVVKSLAELKMRTDFRRIDTGERLAKLLGTMGPVGIKLAQYFAENETLVSDDEIRRDLGSMRDNAPEVPKIAIMSVLYNRTPAKGVLVREVGDKLGVASVKQVNRGKWVDIRKLEKLLKKHDGLEASDRKTMNEAVSRVNSEKTPEALDHVTKALIDLAYKYGIDLAAAEVNVVYKVTRPSLRVTLDSDFAALEAVAKKFEGRKRKRQGSAINVEDLVNTVKGWIKLEKDLRNEARFQKVISRKGMDYSWLAPYEKKCGLTLSDPEVYFSSEQVIVEEEVKGVPLFALSPEQPEVTVEEIISKFGYTRKDAEGLIPKGKRDFRKERIDLYLKKAGSYSEDNSATVTGLDYKAIRDMLRHILMHQVFADGKFHADMHQGNIMITPDGKLYLIDRGNVGSINEAQRSSAKKILKGVLLRDTEAIHKAVNEFFINSASKKDLKGKGIKMSVRDIREILGKKKSLKETLNLLSARAVEGMRSVKPSDEFATMMKALTQAMYLFPTMGEEGLETMKCMLGYIGEDSREVNGDGFKGAIAVWGQIDAMIAIEEANKKKNKGDMRVAAIDRVESLFKGAWYRRMWRLPAVWAATLIIDRAFRLKDEFVRYVKANVISILRDHLGELRMARFLSMSGAAARLITVENIEKILLDFVNDKFKGSVFRKPLVAALKVMLVLMRPFTRIIAKRIQKWFKDDFVDIIDKVLGGINSDLLLDLIKTAGEEDHARAITFFASRMGLGGTGISGGDVMAELAGNAANILKGVGAVEPGERTDLIGKVLNGKGEVVKEFDIEDAGDVVRVRYEYGKGDTRAIEAVKVGDVGISAQMMLVIGSLTEGNTYLSREEKEYLKKFVEVLDKAKITVMENNREIRGGVTTNADGERAIYLSKELASSPLAVIHELGESLGLAADMPVPKRHTAMRGAGKDVRKAYEMISAGLKRDNVNTPEELIRRLNEKMEENRTSLSKARQAWAKGKLITDEEKEAITDNMNKREEPGYAESFKRFGLQASLFGFEDRLDPYSSMAFTEGLRPQKDNLRRGGKNIVIARTSLFQSAQEKWARKAGDKFREIGVDTNFRGYNGSETAAKCIEEALAGIENDPANNKDTLIYVNYLNESKEDKADNENSKISELLRFIEGLRDDQRERVVVQQDVSAEDFGDIENFNTDVMKIVSFAGIVLNDKRLRRSVPSDDEALVNIRKELVSFMVSADLLAPGTELEAEYFKGGLAMARPEELENFMQAMYIGKILVRMTPVNIEEIREYNEAMSEVYRSL